MLKLNDFIYLTLHLVNPSMMMLFMAMIYDDDTIPVVVVAVKLMVKG